MELEIKNENGRLLVKIIGRLDAMTAQKLEKELSKHENGVDSIIFDLEDLKYISSSGIRILISTSKKLNEMKILKPTNEVMDVFEITGLVDIFDIEK